ncbi:GNAT family N-acetyltransferase [Serratia quinivorans]|jgi:ribosomal protein S18 acetylase RimI-like enzyme|uniref:GNAT family N-acetyltransferase n=1 Tax=Serratia quinivorans TaxID=137545 RepID=UPI002178D43C|nr:GNAT family N-acetyltransferase [Serratia quinivorans]CAI1496619.1 Acetyltransferase YpeA [Serratia quinivorans]CAI1511622.1 Acetyltransferase YpeA [Serratia quinivorans]
MLDIKIRRLQAENAEDFRAIRLAALKKSPEMFGSFYALEAEKPLQFFADRLTNCAVFGAYSNGRIVGVMVFKQAEGIKDAHKASLTGVFVEPEFRGQGIANALLKAVIDHGSNQVEQILLTVVADNDAAISLYKKYGFEPYGMEPRALKTEQGYLDEMLMVLFFRR